MHPVKIVGLTGGIASGKSLARTMFEELGVPALDIDVAARVIHQDPAHPAARELAAAFPSVITTDGILRRGSLKDYFAVHPEANRQLKEIVLPYLESDVQEWTRLQSAPYIVWESALLHETSLQADRVILIDVNEEVQVARLLDRNKGWTTEDAARILALQPKLHQRRSHANDTIVNNGTADALRHAVRALHAHYLSLWS
jgi:dephospho-CoA kinase